MKLKHFIFIVTALYSMVSCKEEDGNEQEFVDWQNKNEAYFEQQYQLHSMQPSDVAIIRNWSQPSSKELSEIDHTECILVDVLASGSGTTSPYYTDSVEVHYSGRLIPSPSFPEGYEFDRSFYSTFDPELDVPTKFALNNVVSGFSTAIQHMHRGDYWRVTVPYQLGYGTTTSGLIPAYSTLIFEIYLADFWKEEEGDRE